MYANLNEQQVAFYRVLLNIHCSGVLKVLFFVTWLVPHETAANSANVLWMPYHHAPVYNFTSFKAIYVGCMSVSL